MRWPRFWARQIDFSFCFAAALTILAALGATLQTHGTALLLELAYWPPLVGLLQLVYEVVLVTLLGTTLGKAIMGLRVETQDGRRAELARVCGRSASVWLRGSFAWVLFPLLTPVAWSAAARDLKARASTAWDAGWETRVVGAPLPTWHLALGAALAVAATGIVVALQIHTQGVREVATGASDRVTRPIGMRAPQATADVATGAAPAERVKPAPFTVRTSPGRPNMNQSAESLAAWAERTYPFLVNDGPARRAMFAWMVAGSRAGLPRNHALALGVDIVISGLEDGHGVCWPGAAPSVTDARGKGPTDTLASSMRCER